MAIRRARRRSPSHRSLSLEEELAQIICDKVHDARCACKEGSPSTCGRMLLAAKHAIRFLEDREPTREEAR
ncbi:hypothetical protein FG93_01973 [Bosea sp. LC85]|uniref:hypothetical protein n=1 Tax=Bosea sp. LC85 TaxID=1502851 RepID=UPI0004E2EA07|nr:hypothetical protein [Bosea sp. LC85]KFC73229.1 hypothetical protein FG93_01973 [Bosea sp. LC85]